MDAAAVVIGFTLFLAALAKWPEQLIKILLASSWVAFLLATVYSVGEALVVRLS